MFLTVQDLLRFIVRSSTDAEKLLCASFLSSFAFCTDVVVHLLRLLLRDTHTVTMVPVCTQVTAYIEPKTEE